MCRLSTLVRLRLHAVVWAITLALTLIPQQAAAMDAGVSAQSTGDEETVAQSGAVDETFVFDIPEQPLQTALRIYSESTGQAVLFDDSLTVGRRSTGVSGLYASAEALRQLLQGTGLVAKYSSDHSFTLRLADATDSHEPETAATADASVNDETAALIERYAGKIQKPIQLALCKSAMTRPGTYRLALQIWVGPSGQVQDIHLLSTPDDTHGKEQYVREALDRLMLEPPPKLLPQPITLLFTQAAAGRPSPCAGAAQSLG